MLQQLFSDKLNYGLLLLLVALIFYSSIGFAVEMPSPSDALLPGSENATHIIPEQTDPPSHALTALP